MAILDQLNGTQGIHTLGTQLDTTHSAPGRGDIVLHSNGNLYCVWAATYNVQVYEKRIYIAYSTDNGISWSAPYTVTSGYWDEDPCCVELSESTSIGIVFNREYVAVPSAVKMYRVVVNEACAVTTPSDPMTVDVLNTRSFSIVKTASKYMIACIQPGQSTTVRFIENLYGFADNSWTSRTSAVMFGGATATIYSARVKKLDNDHLALVGVFKTAINGSGTDANVRCDVGISFSDDDGATWSTHQQLTSYTGNPGLDLVGIMSAASAAVSQMSDGRLTVVYQEHIPFQVLKSNTTPAITLSIGIQAVVYHSSKNMVIFGTGTTNVNSDGGLYVFNLTSGSITLIGVPTLWNPNINRMSLSSDEKYLALATENGIQVMDTTDADPANWSIVLSLRTTTTPALKAARVTWISFDPDEASPYVLYWAHPNSGTSKVWGGKIDMNSPSTITDLYMHNSVTPGGSVYGTSGGVLFRDDHLLCSVSNYVVATRKSDGVGLHYYNQTGIMASSSGLYDDVNDEYLFCSTSTFYRFQDTGSAFILLGTIGSAASSIPRIAYPPGYVTTIPGKGAFYPANNANFYSFAGQAVLGAINHYEFLHYLNVSMSSGTEAYIAKGRWLLQPSSTSLYFLPMFNAGRLRYASYTYDADNLQLITSGVDFYDLVNDDRVDTTDFDELATPRMVTLPDDTIVFYLQKLSWLGSPRQFSPIIGILEPDARRMLIRARIAHTGGPVTLSMKARMQRSYTQDLTMLARIVTAQCLKLKARIVPRVDRTLTMRVRMRNWKTSTIPATFSVSQTDRQQILRGQFYVATGYTGRQGIEMRVRILGTATHRVTGHFIIPRTITQNPVTYAFNSTLAHNQRLYIKARIV